MSIIGVMDPSQPTVIENDELPTIQITSTELCDCCMELVRVLCSNPPCNPDGYTHYEWSRHVSPHNTFRECNICRLLTEINRTCNFLPNHDDFPTKLPIYFQKSYCREDIDRIVWLKFAGGTGRKPRLFVWVDNGNESTRDLGISTEVPILTDDLDEAVALIAKWVSKCDGSHGECSETAQEADPTLPSRVLCVKDLNHIKLVENPQRCLKGRYCALSYCWGDEEKNFKTTRDNLEKHLQKIHFSDLPKTFQDASIITHELEVDYLWIDALCILQHDRDDWEQQSQVMGSIYKNSFLTISASASSDPTGGCYSRVQKSNHPATSISIQTDDQHTTRLYLRLMPEGETTPSRGPLARRGWALQERYLSRRKVFFMPGGISWACETLSGIDERSAWCDLGIYDYRSWSSFLEDYTASELTKVGDRLAAIKGIVAKEARLGRYFWGVWETSLVRECLWVSAVEKVLDVDIPDIPSWSWARATGGKFWSIDDERESNLNILPLVSVRFQSSDGRILSASGILKVIHRSIRMNDCCVKISEKGFTSWPRHREYFFIEDLEANLRRPYIFQDENGQFLGFGIFDVREAAPCLFAPWALIRKGVRQEMLYYQNPDSDTETDDTDIDSTESTDSIVSHQNQQPSIRHEVPDQSDTSDDDSNPDSAEYVHLPMPYIGTCDENGCMDISLLQMRDIYHGLLLEPVSNVPGSFKRIGMGFMYPPVFRREERCDYEIV